MSYPHKAPWWNSRREQVAGICLKIDKEQSQGRSHTVRAGGGRLVLESHLGLYMGAMLIRSANGLKSGCFQQRCDQINQASKESIRRALQFPSQGLAERVPCGWRVSKWKSQLKIETLLTFMGTRKCILHDFINIRINNRCLQETLHVSKQLNHRES